MRTAAYLALVLGWSSACGSSGDSSDCPADTSYDPVIDPANFSDPVDNPLYPLTPGAVKVLDGAGERTEMTVTEETRTILGIAAIDFHEVVTLDGAVVEDIAHWVLPDNDGNVWSFGAHAMIYEEGQLVGTEGTWEAGVDGGKPGVIMYATQPEPGTMYRQEYAPCEAEGEAETVSLSESISVPFGDLDGCLQTKETTRLEPDVQEHKYYCPDIGFALEVDITNGERIELIEQTP